MTEGDGIIVWSADLDDALAQLPRSLLRNGGGLLSEQEQARARQIVDEAASSRWAACRAVLRLLLAEAIDADPMSLRFERSAYGKPRLCGGGVRFNVAHSREVALYAISAHREVGVDVESRARALRRRNRDANNSITCKRGRDEIGIAARMLGEQVADRLRSLHGQARSEAFLKAWVAHEAALKCLGTGIGHADDAPHDLASEISICEIDVGPTAVGALAVAGEGAHIERRVWTGEGA